jgi:hypothetical protein
VSSFYFSFENQILYHQTKLFKMKKLLFVLSFLVSFAAFSQIQIIENFDNATTALPTGWTSPDSSYLTNSAYSCSGVSAYDVVAAGTTGTLVSPASALTSNGSDVTLTFDYSVLVTPVAPGDPTNPVSSGWGNISLQYSTDGGANWLNVGTIDSSNHPSSTACLSKSYTIPAASLTVGSNFKFRFVGKSTATYTFRINFDNIKAVQTASSVPNCNAALIAPTNGATNVSVNPTISWLDATGLPSGYKISVGTTSGGTDIVNNLDLGATTSYSPSTLSYSTVYYLTIKPYNSFGTATGCTETTFTTRSAPVPGATFGNPLNVTNLSPSTPYVSSTNTSLYDNDYVNGDSPCSTSYLAGNDVVYKISPTTDISVNIVLSNISQTGAGIHILEGAINGFPSPVCIAYSGINAVTDRTFTDLTLKAGKNYYILIDNATVNKDFNYTLTITQNTCVKQVVTYTTVADCANNQYTVQANVSYMGTATSLTITDGTAGAGHTNSNVTATGTYTFGPYTNGATKTFTVTNNADSYCKLTNSITFTCPPANDECSTASTISVNINATCTSTLAATNFAASYNTLTPSTCQSTINNDVWFKFVATANSAVLQYTNITPATGTSVVLGTELLSGSCGSLTSIQCMTGNYNVLSNLVVGQTYYIRNFSTLTTGGQNFTICLTTPVAVPVNESIDAATTLTESTSSTCNNIVSGTTVDASASPTADCNPTYRDVWYKFIPTQSGYYKFNLTSTSGTGTMNFTLYSGTSGTLTLKGSCLNTTGNGISENLVAGQTYYVKVQSPNTTAGNTFTLCAYALPPAVANNDCSGAASVLLSNSTGTTNAVSGNLDNSYYSPEACPPNTYKAIWYKFTAPASGTYHLVFSKVGTIYYNVYNTSDCSQTTAAGYLTGFTSCYNSTSKDLVVEAGKTYLISVHGSTTTTATYSMYIYSDTFLAASEVKNEELKIYPNPVNDVLHISNKSSIENVEIYNLAGQLLITKNNVKSKEINVSSLQKGIYIVKIISNGIEKSYKIIKQ